MLQPKNLKMSMLLLVSCYAGLFLVLTVAVIYLNRGIGFADEAYYWLAYRYPADCVESPSAFYLMLPKLPRLFDTDLLQYRWLQIILCCLTGIVLALGAARSFHNELAMNEKALFFSIAPVSCLATMLMMAIFPMSASYNTLSSLFTFAAISCFLLAASGSPSRRYGLFACAGFITSFAFFNKFPNGILLLAASSALLLSGESRSRSILVYLAGLLVGILLFFCCFQNMHAWWHAFHVASSQNLHSTSYGSLLPKYFKEFVDGITIIASHNSPVICIPSITCAFLFWLKKRAIVNGMIPIYLNNLILFACFFYISISSIQNRETYPYLSLSWVLILLALCIMEHRSRAFLFKFENFKLLAFLFILPFICAIGSINPLSVQTQIHAAPWAVLASILAFRVCKDTPVFGLGLVATMVLTMTFVFETLFILSPNGLTAPLGLQSEQLDLPLLRGVKVSSPMKDFLVKSNSKLLNAGFQVGDRIIGYCDLEGLVYATGGRSVLMPSFFPDPDFAGMTTRMFRELERLKPPRLFLAISWEPPQSFITELASIGLRFPEDFQSLGSLPCPGGDPYKGFRGGYLDQNYFDGQVYFYRCCKTVE